MATGELYDCIIVGAGPGGLQAAIYLGRYNRNVLLIDRTGGRTAHAKHIENFLGQKLITGKELIEKGKEQAKSFNVAIEQGVVTGIAKDKVFAVSTAAETRRSQFVIVSSGVYDILPPLENLRKFFGISFHTCIDCDGYRLKGRKLVIIGDSVEGINHAFAVKEMYTGDITLVMPDSFKMPPGYEEELGEEGIRLRTGKPVKLIGGERLEAVEMQDGSRIECDAAMSTLGYGLNDGFLSGLALKRNTRGFYITSHDYESSLSGLYIVGPLNTGHDQAVIAAGEGAVAAIDINRRLLDRRGAF